MPFVPNIILRKCFIIWIKFARWNYVAFRVVESAILRKLFQRFPKNLHWNGPIGARKRAWRCAYMKEGPWKELFSGEHFCASRITQGFSLVLIGFSLQFHMLCSVILQAFDITVRPELASIHRSAGIVQTARNARHFAASSLRRPYTVIAVWSWGSNNFCT